MSKHTLEEKRAYWRYFYANDPTMRLKDVPEETFDMIADTFAGGCIRLTVVANKLKATIMNSFRFKKK